MGTIAWRDMTIRLGRWPGPLVAVGAKDSVCPS
jgi:hypothetical protein